VLPARKRLRATTESASTGPEAPRPEFRPGHGEPPDDDLLEAGGSPLRIPQWFPQWFPLRIAQWRPLPIAGILVAVGLLAGLAVGYVAGDRTGESGAVSSAHSRVATFPALSQSGGQCSAQVGQALQLGVQVTNQSGTAVTLRQVRAVLPLGGLAPVSQVWGPCGELPALGQAAAGVLPPGASTWFSITFKVLVKCPRAFPVQFTLGYDQLGRSAVVQLPGFDDLGRVPYPGCPAS